MHTNAKNLVDGSKRVGRVAWMEQGWSHFYLSDTSALFGVWHFCFSCFPCVCIDQGWTFSTLVLYKCESLERIRMGTWSGTFSWLMVIYIRELVTEPLWNFTWVLPFAKQHLLPSKPFWADRELIPAFYPKHHTQTRCWDRTKRMSVYWAEIQAFIYFKSRSVTTWTIQPNIYPRHHTMV